MKDVTFSIGKKFLILNMLLATVSGLILGTVFLSETKSLLIENELRSIHENVKRYENGIKYQIDTLKENVLILSHAPPITGIIRAKNNQGIDPKDGSSEDQWKERLTKIFSDFLVTKPYYLSLRYIGLADAGKELIRVDKRHNTIVNINQDFLQVKGQRDYFKETILLNIGQVYLSEFSLNQEHGRISLPYRPVIRAATPVFSKQGRLFGIIVASLDAEALLNAGIETRLPFYVTNHNGYFLYHKNPEYTFGFDLGLETTIQADMPEVSSMYLPENSVQEQIFKPNKNHPRYSVFSKLKYDSLSPEHFLGIVISETEENLSKGANETLYKLALILVSVVIGGMLLTYLVSLRLTKPLVQLIFASNELAKRKPNIKFPTHLHDEVGSLARALDNMNEALKEGETDLKNSELINRSITNNILDALVTITDKGLIETFNPAAEKLFGYEAHETIGLNVSMLMPDPYKHQHDRYIHNYKQTRIPKIIGFTREVAGQRKDGSVFPMELSVSEMNLSNGKEPTKFFIGLCRNIEARKAIEEDLKKVQKHATEAKEEAESANKAKSEFLSRMSHELRTPLNAILGFAQLELQEEAIRNVSEEDSNLRPIYSAGQHLLALINDVLDISKIEAGHASFILDTVEVVEFIKEIYNQTLALTLENKLSVELLLPENHPDVFINVDIIRLKQIVLNLVSNAIKYNSDTGVVSLVLKVNAETVRIEVKDQGQGISAEKQALLFQAFERLGAETSGVDGTGIGLMIAKQLTEKMQGTLQVESVENVGSNFYVEFPVAEPNKNYLLTTSKLDISYENLDFPNDELIRILYIEDNPTNMAFVSKILSKFPNIEFIPATNPVAGINLLRQHIPNIVLLDLHLPDLDGFEVFQCLRGYKGMNNVPIIALSASANRHDIDKAMGLGFFEYIIKPFEILSFYQTLSKALHHQQDFKDKYIGENDRRKNNRRTEDD